MSDYLRDVVGELRCLGYDRPPYRLTEEHAKITLDFAPPDKSGFSVRGVFEPGRFHLSAEGWHDDYESSEAARDVQGVDSLLSGRMILREYCSSGKPYRWDLLAHAGGQWVVKESVGLLLFNYFGRRTVNERRNTRDR